ncbi:hypothetical protein [Goekera deserti]|uniref:Transmembrane protein n=1 Tax=Goekera deserti TaxID=2497753 RepID=A0A7K3WCN4_9ACTN|nr:hypothetical protein [Goekera deserti]NDI46672.1 hypothetical protein [Goekera deserti]NEL54241.1 hypothetical protein [Goekera deserti]
MTVQWVTPDEQPWVARWGSLAVALLVTAPVLAPGFVLVGDMVFVPQQDLDRDALGLAGGLPRAVPADAVTALVTAVVPGDLVQKLVLVGIVLTAVLGAARLVPPGPDGRRGVAAAAAGLAYGWSPYLGERLLMGHWSLLLAYAALPWVVRAALRLRAGDPGALPRLVLTLAPAALTPTGALLAGGVALVVVGRHRAAGPVAAGVVLLSLPWVLAGLLHPGGGGSDGAGVDAFAARAEGWGGTLVSLLGTGGIWNADAVPGSRTSVLLPVVTLLLVGLAAWGWRTPGALRGPGGRLVLLGAGGLLLALAGTVPGARELLRLVVEDVPGGGLLRDGQKWVAWWALPLALGVGLAARRAAQLRLGLPVGHAVLARVLVAAALLLPVVAVPDLAWGVGGRLQPVEYPADWSAVREAVAADDGPGDVLVLPFSAVRAFGWNDDRPQLDPAPRWLPRTTLVSDLLVVDGRAVDGDDARARAAAAVAGDPAALARLGVGWVLVERGTPGAATPAGLAGLDRVVDGEWLQLLRVPDAQEPPAPATSRLVAVVAGHLLAGGSVIVSWLWLAGSAVTVSLRQRHPGKRYR